MAHRRRFLRAAGALGAASTVAGCLGGGTAGGDADESTDTDAPADTTAASDTTTAPAGDGQSAFPDYEWGTLDGVDPTPATTITMRNVEFNPLVATMPPGTELTVVNEDSGDHTVTVPALDVDETLAGGESTTFTVDAAGTYDYVCELHPPGMLGRLVVDEDAGTPASDGGSGDDTETETEGGGVY